MSCIWGALRIGRAFLGEGRVDKGVAVEEPACCRDSEVFAESVFRPHN